jgi:RES domain-containing protein
VTVWRICKRQYAPAAFSGDGGLRAAMRWNHKGPRMVYAAQSLSLATLELWVHIPTAEPLASYVSIAAEIPDDLPISVFEPETLPRDWREDAAPASLRDLGTRWLISKVSVAARVPSVIVPTEYNYLLNPEHTEFARIRMGEPMPFLLDRRMWKLGVR